MVGCVVALAVLGAACGGGGKSASTTSTTVKYDVAAGVGSPAATLRTQLTDLLQEHALLVGMAAGAQLSGQNPAPITAVLDQNSADLGKLVGDLYPAAGAAFLDQWKRHAAALIAYSSVATGDKAAQTAAKAQITDIEKQLTTTLNTANVQLTPEALTKTFSDYSGAVLSAISAQAKKDEAAAAKLKKAADGMATPAIVLAAGIVKQKADSYPGKLDGISSDVRATFGAGLQQHVYLTGLVTGLTIAGADAKAATEALDENSRQLSRVVAAAYSDEAARRFLQLWRQHVGYVVDFASASAANDVSKQDAARSALADNSDALAGFFSTADDKLSKEELDQQLGDHVDALLGVVQAQAAKDPATMAKLRAAALESTDLALYLATGIAQQNPTKFG
ncbi:MAG TPA: hypothetical protein VFJ85_00650 [Acidimicrobiales bacterium]|nr:hypothetical protein [Acidimicrobiales bacterium]